MIGKTLLLSSIMFALYASTRTKYPIYIAANGCSRNFGGGIWEARKKNRRNKIMRRRRRK